jgi:hypothetical protein
MTWDIDFTDDFEWWFMHLLPETASRVIAKVDLLEEQGPSLGRPHVAQIDVSRETYGAGVKNLKELRVGTIRILFAFDPDRTAYLLVGFDKRGDWDASYDRAIPKALEMWAEHLAELERKNR